MSEPDDQNQPAIAAVHAALERLGNDIQEALGKDLHALILFGGLAKGEYHPAGSDVNVMVVLKQVTMRELDMLAPILQRGMQNIRLAPLVLTERDLRRSTDVFPVKFLDMQRHHRVVCGRDVLGELTISQDHLRLRAEQQIKNLLLRLRLFYLRRAQHAELIETALTGAISSLCSSLAVLLSLKTGAAPASKDRIVDAAAQAFGLDGRVLHDVLALKVGRHQPDDAALRRLYGEFMVTVERAADVVDQL